MKTSDSSDDQAAKKSAFFWMLFPVALLATSVTGWLVMVKIAVDDPGFAVEADYYKKAANYDSVINQRAENARLGYDVEVVSFAPMSEESAHLVLKVRDAEGQSLERAHVTVDALPVARAFDVQTLTLASRGAGVFETDVLRMRTGLWELRVRIEFMGRVFTRVLRPELARNEGHYFRGGRRNSAT